MKVSAAANICVGLSPVWRNALGAVLILVPVAEWFIVSRITLAVHRVNRVHILNQTVRNVEQGRALD